MSRGSERGFGGRNAGDRAVRRWPAGREGTQDKVCLVHSGRKAGSGYTHVFGNKTLSFVVNQRVEGTTVHGIFQARILEWIAILFSRGSSQPRD